MITGSDASTVTFTAEPTDEQVIRQFNRLWYTQDYGTWDDSTWMGVKVWKAATDLFIYSELIYRLRPDLIIETGTAFGGSALYLAHMLDLIGKGWVISIDWNPMPNLPQHKRIQYVIASSTDAATVELATKAADGLQTRMVILDSDHHKEHVFRELRAYAPLVTKGSYLIVEDTNLNGHPVQPNFGPGPFEAVQQFLSSRIGQDFYVDRHCERLLLTQNPNGYLKKR